MIKNQTSVSKVSLFWCYSLISVWRMLLEQSVFPLSRGTFLFIWSMWNLFLSLSVFLNRVIHKTMHSSGSSVSHRDRGLHLLRFLFTTVLLWFQLPLFALLSRKKPRRMENKHTFWASGKEGQRGAKHLMKESMNEGVSEGRMWTQLC